MRFDRQRGSDLSRLLGGLKQANDLKVTREIRLWRCINNVILSHSKSLSSEFLSWHWNFFDLSSEEKMWQLPILTMGFVALAEMQMLTSGRFFIWVFQGHRFSFTVSII